VRIHPHCSRTTETSIRISDFGNSGFGFRAFLAVLLLMLTALSAPAADGELAWGATAITLPAPLLAPPALNDLLADDAKAISLKPFYLAGGEPRPATPTECHVAYSEANLWVLFRCGENDPSFPAKSQSADWYALLRSPSEQDSGFPDKVDLFIQPDPQNRSFYQFAATLDGLRFGCRHGLRTTNEPAQTDEDATAQISPHSTKVTAFTATVARRQSEWIVLFSIPWKTVGGKPKDYFGLLPMRTRWRSGEVSSPVAMDFNERPPVDLFIETSFADANSLPANPASLSMAARGQGVRTPSSPQTTLSSLIKLPSGTLRWQRPAVLSYPGLEIIRQIWHMQQTLNEPVDPGNLGQRLYLTQRWIDLLTLEGFNFHPGGGGIVPHEMAPNNLRRNLNAALRSEGVLAGSQLLEAYLKKLDHVSKQWFADGSPGDILQAEWKMISSLESAQMDGDVLRLHCLADKQQVDMQLSLPQSGGVRIHGQDEGYFKPAGLLPLKMISSKDSRLDDGALPRRRYAGVPLVMNTAAACTIETADGRVVIGRRPFAISFHDTNGNPALRLGPGGLGFRFSLEGKVIAVDCRMQLDTNETIFGFGERYDRFNENGRVLTLWGMDDWVGNTVGLLNQTYKPIPIFHSSKNKMVFDNSSYRLRADIGKTRPEELRLTQQGPVFDYYFWMMPPEQALQSYTELTGKPVLPPKWAFEPWMGRTGRGWNQPSQNMVAEEESVERRFEKLDIPHSAIYAEGGGNAESPELNAFMAARGIKVLSWFFPVIPLTNQMKLMPEFKPEDLPVLRTEDLWDHVDFTNPNALELMRRVWRQRLSAGVAGSMVDFGDRVKEDAVAYDGQSGAELHNFYAYDYHRTCSEVFRERRGDDFILFGRAAAPGTQKWVGQFAGDHPSNFKGLQSVLTGALNLCSCGFSTWGSDLGGFLGWPEPAVYIRWTQFGCFSPLMRCHGRTPREPWNYGDAALANYKFHAWVRENLLDYIYSAAMEAHETGVPMMRSLAVTYPQELPLAAIHDEYMFGGDLLVAPVLDENNFRTVYFPAGRWTSLWDGKTVPGPAKITLYVPLNLIPVYLKAGTMLPVRLSPTLMFGESMSHGRVNALAMTPPSEKQTRSWFIAKAEGRQAERKNPPEEKQTRSSLTGQVGEAEAVLRPTPDGFDLTLRDHPEIDYLVIYDLHAGAVSADGHVLRQLQNAPYASMPPGWCADSSLNRMVIRLPAGQATREVKLKF